MQTHIITWATIHQHGDLWWQHHEIRKRLFVDAKRWNIPHTDAAEWDQYDTPATVYVITEDGGRVIAASRLNPCTDREPFSYMIRDAALGRIANIPAGIIDTAPVCPDTFEATRFTVDPEAPSPAQREAAATNARAIAEEARARGGRHLLALMAPGFARWLTRLDLPTEQIGPVCRDAEGAKICVLRMQTAH